MSQQAWKYCQHKAEQAAAINRLLKNNSDERTSSGGKMRFDKKSLIVAAVHRPHLLLLAALLCGIQQVQAQTSYATVPAEYSKLIQTAGTVKALGEGLFGDAVSTYTGALEIAQVDVDVPGNSALPVRMGRRFRLAQGPNQASSGAFLDWDLDIPHLHGVFSGGWRVSGTNGTQYQRCSNFSTPPGITSGGGTFAGNEYWHGSFLYLPGIGDRQMLQRGAQTPYPSDGKAYPVVTKDNTVLRCLPTLAATSQAGSQGEGFEAVLPDGTVYTFNHMVSRGYATLQKAQPGSVPDSVRTLQAQRPTNYQLARQEVLIYPTKVTDRFGNIVTYNWSASEPQKLQSITASDGRSLTVTYTGNTITNVSDGSRNWVYGFANNGLASVTLPDSRQWSFGMTSLNQSDFAPPDGGTCDVVSQAGGWASGYMVHPSGARIDLTMQPVLIGRSWVPRQCWLDAYALTPSQYYGAALTTKKLSGPGLPPAGLQWSYSYGADNGCWDPTSVPSGVTSAIKCSASLPTTRTVSVTRPDNTVTRYTFGNRFQVNEGQLLQLDEGWNGSIALRTTVNAYASPNAGPYPTSIGYTGQSRGNGYMSTVFMPMRQRVITQQGQTFTWEVPAFDTRARPSIVTRTSSAGPSRSESNLYYDHTTLWVLSQIATITSSGLVAVENTYDASTAQLLSIKQFNVPEASFTYHGDGTLATHSDGAGHATAYDNYKRGLPQTITFPTNASKSASVDDHGWINSITDEASYTTGYTYDPMGRLASITPPAGFTGTTQVFESVNSAEYGLAAGHWRQTISKGNARTITYLDALWRPVMTRTFDATSPATEAATRKVVVKQFDAGNRTTYESYPARDVGTYDAMPGGVQTSYDALGRPTQAVANSELGNLTTSTSYLSGFQTQITNARNKTTTQSFWVLDDPAAAQLAGISAPEGVTVSISRDAFGKPTAITRGGTSINTNVGYTSSVTRRYVYGTGQRLCKTIEPEVGATVQTYDAAGNIQWKAPGQNLPDYTPGACNDASVAANAKLTYGYDNLNRLLNVTYGDGSPSITRTYTPDGLLQSIASNGSTWTYGYNALRKPATETLNYVGQNYGISWGYNTAGDLSTLTYPDGVTTVSYSPNALGEAQSVGGYASGIAYHPNGAVAGYTLGNTIAHTLTQNTRGLPLVNRDAGVMQDQYTYDANGNITAIADQQEGVFNRSMGYDDLDRLASTSAPSVWGTATYKYDTVDNLRSAVVGSRSSVINFDANNQLSTVTTNGSATNYVFSPLGNLLNKGGQSFGFDLGNRLTSSSGGTYAYDGLGRRIRINSSDLSVRIQVYSQAGQLLWATSNGGPRPSSATAYVYLGGKQLAENTNGSVQYVHTDGLGSPVAHTNSSAALLNRARFEPYGYVAAGTKPSASTSVIGFTGHVQDSETDLVYMQQRYYDPIVGRFLSIDPIVTDANTGKGFGLYTYVDNKPYSHVDPDGRAPDSADPVYCLSGACYESAPTHSAFARAQQQNVEAQRVMAKAIQETADDVLDGIATLRFGDSRKLGKEIEKATGIARAKGEDSHHIVSADAKLAAASKAILDKFSIDINSAFNGVYLPRGYHSRLHTPTYHLNVYQDLRTSKSAADVVFRLQQIRVQIIAGTYPF